MDDFRLFKLVARHARLPPREGRRVLLGVVIFTAIAGVTAPLGILLGAVLLSFPDLAGIGCIVLTWSLSLLGLAVGMCRCRTASSARTVFFLSAVFIVLVSSSFAFIEGTASLVIVAYQLGVFVCIHVLALLTPLFTEEGSEVSYTSSVVVVGLAVCWYAGCTLVRATTGWWFIHVGSTAQPWVTEVLCIMGLVSASICGLGCTYVGNISGRITSASNEELEALVARAAHDMRQPLHALVATLEILSDKLNDALALIKDSRAKDSHEAGSAAAVEAIADALKDLATIEMTQGLLRDLVQQFLTLAEARHQRGKGAAKEPIHLEQLCSQIGAVSGVLASKKVREPALRHSPHPATLLPPHPRPAPPFHPCINPTPPPS